MSQAQYELDTFTKGLIAGTQLGQNAKRDRTRSEQDRAELEALGAYRAEQTSLGLGRLESANQGRSDLKEHRGQTLELQRDKLNETRENHGALVGLKQQGLDDDRRHDRATEGLSAQKLADARSKAAEHLGSLEQERNAAALEWSQYNPEPGATTDPATGGLVPSATEGQESPDHASWAERKQIFTQLDAPTRRSILAGHRKQAEKQEATQKADLQLKVYAKTGAARYLSPAAVAKVIEAASPHAAQAFLEGLDPQTQQALAGVKPQQARPATGLAGYAQQALAAGPEGVKQLLEWSQDFTVGPGGVPKESPMAQAAKGALLQAFAQTGDIRLLPERYPLQKALQAAQQALLANTSPKKQTELINALGAAKNALSAFDASHAPAKPATTPQEQPDRQTPGNMGEPPRGGREPSQEVLRAAEASASNLATQIAAAMKANPQKPGEPDDAYKARIKALLGAPQ